MCGCGCEHPLTPVASPAAATAPQVRGQPGGRPLESGEQTQGPGPGRSGQSHSQGPEKQTISGQSAPDGPIPPLGPPARRQLPGRGRWGWHCQPVHASNPGPAGWVLDSPVCTAWGVGPLACPGGGGGGQLGPSPKGPCKHFTSCPSPALTLKPTHTPKKPLRSARAQLAPQG